MAALVACLLLLGGSETPARAAFPGTNGKIAFSTLLDSADFVSDFGDFDIFVMNADGSGLVALTGYGADDSQPAFSPDGSRIAFTSSRTGNAEIFVMSADGTNVTQVTHNSAEEFDPAFSADGARIACPALDQAVTLPVQGAADAVPLHLGFGRHPPDSLCCERCRGWCPK